MRSLVTIVMLCLFVLQSSWAVAAAYCAHEAAPGAAHVGHHQHEHEVASTAPAGDDAPVATHADCHACHACTVGLADAGRAATAEAEAGFRAPLADPSPAAPPPTPVERPDWRHLA